MAARSQNLVGGCAYDVDREVAPEVALDFADEVDRTAAVVEERGAVEGRLAVWSAGRRNWVANHKGGTQNREKVV